MATRPVFISVDPEKAVAFAEIVAPSYDRVSVWRSMEAGKVLVRRIE